MHTCFAVACMSDDLHVLLLLIALRRLWTVRRVPGLTPARGNDCQLSTEPMGITRNGARSWSRWPGYPRNIPRIRRPSPPPGQSLTARYRHIVVQADSNSRIIPPLRLASRSLYSSSSGWDDPDHPKLAAHLFGVARISTQPSLVLRHLRC